MANVNRIHRLHRTGAGVLVLGMGLALIWLLVWLGSRATATRLPALRTEPGAGRPRFAFSIAGPAGGLLRPMAVVESAAGDVYVADTGHAVVQVFDHAGQFLRTVGRPAATRPPGDGELVYPVGLAVDDQNRLYVADVQAGRIVVFSPAGEFAGTLGEGQVGSPAGLVYHAGRLFVNDLSAQQVVVLDQDRVLARYGGPAGDRLAYANYSAISPGGQLAVADSNNNRVVIFSSAGAVSATLRMAGGEALLMPRGIAYDARGRLHVVSTFRHQVLVFDPSLALTASYGERGEGAGQLNFPNGLWIGGERAYVADRENNRVQVWQWDDTR